MKNKKYLNNPKEEMNFRDQQKNLYINTSVFFFKAAPWHMEVPGSNRALAENYTTAAATRDP